jgi:esterase/lipase superfamily enzyme
VVNAQLPSAPTADPDQQSIEGLEVTRLALEQQIATKLARLGSYEDPGLDGLKGQLLVVTGNEESAREAQSQQAKSLFSQANFLQIPVLFVTDRASNPDGVFTAAKRPSGVAFGKAVVTLSTPYGVRQDLISDARRLPKGTKVEPPSVQPLRDFASLTEEIAKRKGALNGKDRRVLLFVHGYNVSFEDAVNTTARLASEMQVSVIPVAYSWPSEGSFLGYWHDEDTVRASTVRFTEFLRNLLSKSPTEVVIVCHSMGARMVTSALSELGANHANMPALHHVIFAAADIAKSDFEEAWPSMRSNAVAFTFYCSDRDLALRLSHIVHSYQRVGDAAPTVFAPAHATTIDASGIDSVWLGFGHSYIVNSPIVGADAGQWIDTDAPAAERGLVKATHADSQYFLFP